MRSRGQRLFPCGCSEEEDHVGGGQKKATRISRVFLRDVDFPTECTESYEIKHEWQIKNDCVISRILILKSPPPK